MEIEQYLYDLNDSGEAIVAYKMQSSAGGSVQICNLGASVLSLSLPDSSGAVRDVASGGCVRGLSGLLDDRERFGERLWESRVEVNRVVMGLSYEYEGIGITAEVIFDFDDDDVLEITYQAVVEPDATFDLTHNLRFDLGGSTSCELKSEVVNDNICLIEGAKRGILAEVAELFCADSGYRIKLLSSQPALYYNAESCEIAPVSSPAELLKEGVRFVQKSVYQPIKATREI
ncbi:MAG: hypothetical protein R3Y68_08290 [Rikenellaceae bacterium]